MIVLLVFLFVAIPTSANAHLVPGSSIELDFGGRAVRARVTIPVNELAFATGRRTLTMPQVLATISVTTPDGRPWRIAGKSLRTDSSGPETDFVADLSMTPPEGAAIRSLRLHYTAIIDRVPSHIVMVFARSDFAAGVLQSDPQLIGALRQGQTSLAIDRGGGSGWRGFGAAIGLGMDHIAEGHDHLLFLLALLLPAPLLAAGRRWNGYAGWRPMLRKLIAVVTAFTIGHSITLIGGAFFGWRLPAQPVEIGIAISILVSAIHAWRPLFAGREPWLAGAFGLVHGLAFATIVGNFALEPLAKAQAILGFNVGIELVQLAVTAAALPLLIVAGRSSAFPAIRSTGAAIAGIAALAWAVERITGSSNVIAETINIGLGYAAWPLAALSTAALFFLRPPAPRTASAPV